MLGLKLAAANGKIDDAGNHEKTVPISLTIWNNFSQFRFWFQETLKNRFRFGFRFQFSRNRCTLVDSLSWLTCYRLCYLMYSETHHTVYHSKRHRNLIFICSTLCIHCCQLCKCLKMNRTRRMLISIQEFERFVNNMTTGFNIPYLIISISCVIAKFQQFDASDSSCFWV